MKEAKPREFWIRTGVFSLPSIFEYEPKHLTSSEKYGWKSKFKGSVVHVIEMSAYQSLVIKCAELEAENAELKWRLEGLEK